MKAKKRYFIGDFSDVTDEVLKIIGGCRCDLITDDLKQKTIFKLRSTDKNTHPELEKFNQITKEIAVQEVAKIRQKNKDEYGMDII